MRIFLFLLLWATSALQGFAFDADRAMRAIETLASDHFQGRRSGLLGGQRTEEFLAEQLAAAGVMPAGWNHTYFQEVPMLVTREDGAQLTLMESPFGKVVFTYGDDFTLLTHSGSGAFIAPVAIVGYGIDRPDKNREDYGDLDVRGHAVVVVRKSPPNQAWDFSLDYPREKLVRWALEREAAAILFYQENMPIQGGAIHEGVYHPKVPMFYIGDRVMRLLLRDTGFTLNTYLATLEKGANPLNAHKRLWVSARVSKTSSNAARNVVGFVYGTDPTLRGEIIAIGAHWDHIGQNGNLLTYNGADDDASGCGLVLELARVVAQDIGSPKRSLLILFFAGEENGLLGSQHFTANPTVPLGQIVAMLNFDMVGQGDGTVGIAGGELLGRVWKEYTQHLTSDESEKLHFYRTSTTWYGDYGPFHRAGVPSISLWSAGEHPFYHQYEDDAKYIRREVIESVGTHAQDLLLYLLNDYPYVIGRPDSLRLLTRLNSSMDWKGFDLFDASLRRDLLPTTGIHLVWLRSPLTSTWTFIEAMARLQRICNEKDIHCGTLPTALQAFRRHEPAFVFGITAEALAGRPLEEVEALLRQGVRVVEFGPAQRQKTKLGDDVISALEDEGVYALMPMDYSTPLRVRKWGNRSLVHASVGEFSVLPQAMRDSLAMSPAILLLDATAKTEARDMESIRPYAERTVCLSLAPLLRMGGEEAAMQAVSRLYEAGLSREQITLLLTDNLRRLIR
ncbi:MAG: M28 family peptidase [Calditrichaeota bacterium]|nr:M28 family peptidase [Calditrichota bacterium]